MLPRLSARSLLSLALVTPLLASCSLLGLDDLMVARCRIDADCAGFGGGVSDPACEQLVCNVATELCEVVAIDLDEDGEPSIACGGTDCNDEERNINSSATEICDGVDNDCTFALEGPGEDDDGDGYADDVCAGALAADCDDEDPLTYRGAPELCDLVDNDCVLDGFIRIGGGPREEPSEDADGDGFAAIDAACTDEGPEGVALLPKTDCDDTRADVSPGAFEACDGVDNDCDGIPDNAAGDTRQGSACLPVEIAAGRDHTCARNLDGTVDCWGRNHEGQLGVPEGSLPPDRVVRVPGIVGATQIIAGNNFSCALDRDGFVTCWGNSAMIEAAQFNSENAFGEVPVLTGAVAISAGQYHACAVLEDGRAQCWGRDCWGDLVGTGGACEFSQFARDVPGLTDVTQVTGGDLHSCALHASGRVSCWGANFYGAVGSGTGSPIVEVGGLTDVVEVRAGLQHTCARRSDGTVWCWGEEASLACGSNPGCPDGSGPPFALSPVQVVGLDDATALFAGRGRHTCAQRETGAVVCWGQASEGQVGVSPTANVETPTLVPELSDALSLSLGGRHTCALRPSGVVCWGAADYFQLGDGRNDHTDPDPFFASERTHAVSVTARPFAIGAGVRATCFLTPSGQVRCAGSASASFGRRAEFPEVPLVSFDGATATQLAISGNFGCILRPGGAVRCAGDDGAPLGVADAEGDVTGLSEVVAIATGTRHACAVAADGSVSCWGDNARLQLGSNGGESASPRLVEGVSEAVAVTAGDLHSCALDRAGRVSCWGGNEYGELGNRPVRTDALPREVSGLPSDDPVVQIDAAVTHTCATLESGEVWCWGLLQPRPTPGATYRPEAEPRSVEGVEGAVEVQIGTQHACARLAAGPVLCWGESEEGALGTGTTGIGFRAPAAVADLDDASVLDCGAFHCCAVSIGAGQPLCWGDNYAGQLAARIQSPPITSWIMPGAVADLLTEF